MHPLVEGSTDPQSSLGGVDSEQETHDSSAELEDNCGVVFVNARLRDENEEKEQHEHHVDRLAQWHNTENHRRVTQRDGLILLNNPVVEQVVDQKSLSGVKRPCDEKVP